MVELLLRLTQILLLWLWMLLMWHRGAMLLHNVTLWHGLLRHWRTLVNRLCPSLLWLLLLLWLHLWSVLEVLLLLLRVDHPVVDSWGMCVPQGYQSHRLLDLLHALIVTLEDVRPHHLGLAIGTRGPSSYDGQSLGLTLKVLGLRLADDERLLLSDGAMDHLIAGLWLLDKAGLLGVLLLGMLLVVDLLGLLLHVGLLRWGRRAIVLDMLLVRLLLVLHHVLLWMWLHVVGIVLEDQRSLLRRLLMVLVMHNLLLRLRWLLRRRHMLLGLRRGLWRLGRQRLLRLLLRLIHLILRLRRWWWRLLVYHVLGLRGRLIMLGWLVAHGMAHRLTEKDEMRTRFLMVFSVDLLGHWLLMFHCDVRYGMRLCKGEARSRLDRGRGPWTKGVADPVIGLKSLKMEEYVSRKSISHCLFGLESGPFYGAE